MAEIGRDIHKGAKFILNGEVIGMPTETVYGLAGNALNESSILKIYQVKNRPKFDPLIAHFSSIEHFKEYINLDDKQQLLANSFWPGALTMLLDKPNGFPDMLTSGLPLVACRIPAHDMARNLINEAGVPLAAPSANPFGFVSPVSAKHVNDQLGNKVPYILDGGHSKVGLESTIIGFERYKTIVYRLGGISIEQIEAVIGSVELEVNQSSNPKAPGMLKSHYSPGIPLVLTDNVEHVLNQHVGKVCGVISYRASGLDGFNEQVLSSKGSLEEAAKNLFSALREMAEAKPDIIIAEKVPNEGIGRAINDRLKRASV